MPSLFNPWVIIGISMLISGALGGGYYKGHHDAYLEQQAEIARLNEEARETEHRLQEKVTAQANELRKEQDNAKAEIARLNDDIVSGAVRLSIACSNVQPAAKPSPAPRAGSKARCDIDQQAARSLVDIAAQGDEAIRQLNALIDFYNTARDELSPSKGQ
jgi:hypothetical protein